MHLWQFPTKILKNHDFTFSPILLPSHKKPIHPTWLSLNPTKINSFRNQTFHTSFWMNLWHFPTKIAKKPWLHLFTNFSTKAQKVNPPNLAKPKRNQDQFILQPNFLTSHFECICDNSPPRLLQNNYFTFWWILLQWHRNLAKRPNMAKPKPNQDQFLLQPNFWHLILDAFVTIPHQDCSKTMTSHFHQFCYQDTKIRPSDETWLSENPTKINSFCNQSFQTSFWMHLWQFPTKIAQKPWLHFFTNFATKTQN